MPLLEVRDLVAGYGPIRALDGVSLAFRGGEVHAVIGENGAGKSTLMKVLAGIVRPDAGGLRLDGREVAFRSVREANRAGVALIHQELNLVDDLDVAGNIFLGQERTRWGFLDRAAMRRRATELLAEVGATIDPRAIVRELPVASRQLVEIAKAIALDARFLLMDEPTAVLSDRETRSLFALIRRLRGKGVGIVYISHLLPEVRAISDRVSVLRDGRFVAELDPKATTETELATAMVGRAMEEVFPARKRPDAASPALEVRGLVSGHAVRDVSLAVAPGEILGLAGLVGSGRTETAEAICGLRKVDAGEIRLLGKPVRFRSPKAAKAAGLAYVSEDRKGRGVHLDLPCATNVTLANLDAYGRIFPSRARERASVRGWIDRLAVKAPDASAPIRTLSGGNMQKLAVAKWLDTRPRVLVLDEPTRGIDLGAKRQMYALIAELAAGGVACVVISSELPELIGLCHRIAVLRNGRIAGTLDAATATEESLIHLAAGVDAAAPAGAAA